jgi:hypothetical protein
VFSEHSDQYVLNGADPPFRSDFVGYSATKHIREAREISTARYGIDDFKKNGDQFLIRESTISSQAIADSLCSSVLLLHGTYSAEQVGEHGKIPSKTIHKHKSHGWQTSLDCGKILEGQVNTT